MIVDKEIVRLAAREYAGLSPVKLIEIVKKADADHYAAYQRKDRREERRTRYEGESARTALAIKFGERNGWQLTTWEFDLGTLSKGKVHAGSRSYMDRYYAAGNAFDHAYHYRNEDRRAVALACHLYGGPGVLKYCEEACRHWGLTFETPQDYPSWWLPGSTTLIVYKRQKPS